MKQVHDVMNYFFFLIVDEFIPVHECIIIIAMLGKWDVYETYMWNGLKEYFTVKIILFSGNDSV